MDAPTESHPPMPALQAIDRRLGPLVSFLLRPLTFVRRPPPAELRVTICDMMGKIVPDLDFRGD